MEPSSYVFWVVRSDYYEGPEHMKYLFLAPNFYWTPEFLKAAHFATATEANEAAEASLRKRFYHVEKYVIPMTENV